MIRLALGLMPMQLLNLGPLLSLATARAFWTKTPRGAFSVYRIHFASACPVPGHLDPHPAPRPCLVPTPEPALDLGTRPS
jgi:hypothetical protein